MSGLDTIRVGSSKSQDELLVSGEFKERSIAERLNQALRVKMCRLTTPLILMTTTLYARPLLCASTVAVALFVGCSKTPPDPDRVAIESKIQGMRKDGAVAQIKNYRVTDKGRICVEYNYKSNDVEGSYMNAKFGKKDGVWIIVEVPPSYELC